MDWQAIATFVSTLGFPIAMCFMLWQYNTKTMDEVKKALNNNTQALQQVMVIVQRDWKERECEKNGK